MRFALVLSSALVMANSMPGTLAFAGEKLNPADTLRKKLIHCWMIPADATMRSVKVRFTLNRDGSIATGPAIVSPSQDKRTKLLEQAALRAVKRCNPYTELTAFSDSYESWREMTVNFDANLVQ